MKREKKANKKKKEHLPQVTLSYKALATISISNT